MHTRLDIWAENYLVAFYYHWCHSMKRIDPVFAVMIDRSHWGGGREGDNNDGIQGDGNGGGSYRGCGSEAGRGSCLATVEELYKLPLFKELKAFVSWVGAALGRKHRTILRPAGKQAVPVAGTPQVRVAM
jgi:hypothetical protein